MRRRHGLTLVEVLASTVLLAILAATCLPLFQGAMRAFHSPEPPFDLLELSQLADSFIADPTAFGAESLPEEGELEAPWPAHPARPPVTVRRLTAEDPEVDHDWLAFSSGRWDVYRWVQAQEEEEEPTP